MENPSSRGALEIEIDNAIRAYNAARAAGVIGASQVRYIAIHLRNLGFIKE